MIFGFGKRDDEDDEEEEIELVLFQGALNGEDPNLGANAKLVQAGLMRTKELVSDALSRRAEMIRLEPKGGASVATFYVDGVPYPGARMPPPAGLAVTQMMKLLSGLNIQERAKPQSGGIKAEYDGKKYTIRVDVSPIKGGGERLNVRAQDNAVKLETPEEIGLSDKIRDLVRTKTSDRQGVLLAAGAAMSGVSTTAMGLMRCIDAYMYTIYNLADLGGRDISRVANFEKLPGDTLQQTLSRAKRAEADVLFVDPLRDAESTRTYFDNADEVCFVSEVRAPDAAAAIVQIKDWLESPELTADRLRLVIAQKLIRLLCRGCRQAFRPNPKLLQKVGLPPETKVLYRQPRPVEVEGQMEEPEFCEKCGGIGYLGRTAIFEVIEMTDGVKAIVAAGGDAAAIRAQAKKEGMSNFQADGLRLVAAGKTSLEELQRMFKS